MIYRSLAAHIRTHTGEKLHEGTQCSKRLKQTDRLAGHIQTHTGEKQFRRTGSLTAHVRTHTGEKPHE